MGVVRNPTLKAEKTNFSNNPEMSTTGDLKFGAFYCCTTFFSCLNIINPPHSWCITVGNLMLFRARAREQGWCRVESTLPPPMWPRFESWRWHHNVGWVCCRFSPLLREVFLLVLQFFPLLKNQHFQIPIQSGTHGHGFNGTSMKLLHVPAPRVNKKNNNKKKNEHTNYYDNFFVE